MRGSSSLVGIVSLVLDVGKRWESSGTETVKLILEEHDLFFLLFDNIDHLALIGDCHDTFLGVGSSVIVSC